MSNIYDLYKQNLTEDSNDGFDTGVRSPWKTLKVRQDFSELEDGTVLKPGTFFEYVSKNAPVSEDGSVGVTFTESDHIDCLVFATRTSRVLWDKNNKETPRCQSYNGDYPDVRDPVSPSCKTCPYAKTGECKPTAALLLGIPKIKEGGEFECRPYNLQLGKAGLRTTRTFVQNTLLSHVQETLGIPAYLLITRIKTKQIEGASYKYYAPVFPNDDYYDKQVEGIKAGKRGFTEEQVGIIRKLKEELVPLYKQSGQSEPQRVAIEAPAPKHYLTASTDSTVIETSSEDTEIVDFFAGE